MKNKVTFLILFALFILSSNVYSFQEPPEPNIPPPVGLPATINDKIIFLIIAGGVLGFFILRKKKV